MNLCIVWIDVALHNEIKNEMVSIKSLDAALGRRSLLMHGGVATASPFVRGRMVVHPSRLWAVGVKPSHDSHPCIQDLHIFPHLFLLSIP